MEEKAIENIKEPSSSNASLTESELYKKNAEVNKNKMLLIDFVVTVTKIDYCFETLQGNLLWVGLMEFAFWVILLALFFSDMKYMVKVFFFIFHIPRGITGLIILYYLPKTYEVIEALDNFDTNSLEEIKERVSTNYIKILSSKEKFLKPMLIAYFVLTMITIVVDIIMFCVITPDFGSDKVFGQFFAVLLIINLCLIVGDFVYILFFTGFKYFFPPAQNEAAHKAVIGFFTQLKVGIATGFTNIAKKISKKSSNVNDQRNVKIDKELENKSNDNSNNKEQDKIVKEEISLKVEDSNKEANQISINEPSSIDPNKDDVKQ